MFFPLGLGGKVKKIPWAILAITGICVAWSFVFFDRVDKAQDQVSKMTSLPANGDVPDGLSQRKAQEIRLMGLMNSTCLQRAQAFCGIIAQAQKSMQEGTRISKADIEKQTKQLSYKDRIAYQQFLDEFEAGQDSWGSDVKRNPAFVSYIEVERDLRAKAVAIYAENGYLTTQSVSIYRAIRAMFSHDGFAHLIFNLIFLVLIGIWVEQRAGSLITGLVFCLGSFAGFIAHLWFSPSSAVIGASGGIFALMGMYFSFFYHKEVLFLFTLFPVYFRRIFLPARWTFPFFYLFADVIAVQAGSRSSTAHLAHIGGLLVGLLVGGVLRKLDHLHPDSIYPQEVGLINKIKTSGSAPEIWAALKNLNEWNVQNWAGLELFLRRAKELHLEFHSKEMNEKMTQILKTACVHYLKRSELARMSSFIRSIPTGISLSACLSDVPTSQILFVADHLANKEELTHAVRLYELALSREKPGSEGHQLITAAINQTQQLAVS